jgi:chromosome segregation ATPase
MFIYKKLFTFPKPFLDADLGNNGAGGNGDGTNPGNNDNGAQKDQTDSNKKDDQGQTDPNHQQEEKTVPYSRFSELNKKTRDLQTQLDTLITEKTKQEKEKEKQERELKEKQGEFEKLYTETKDKYEAIETENTGYKARVETLEAVVQELLNSELNDIDKEHQELIPDLSVEDKLSWIIKAKNNGLFGKKEENPIGGASNPPPATKKVGDMTPNELIKMAFTKK